MTDDFDISGPSAPTTGDYLSFQIIDGDKERPGRISGTALAVLGTGTREEIYLANIDRIRSAAREMCRSHPTLDIIILGSNNFS